MSLYIFHFPYVGYIAYNSNIPVSPISSYILYFFYILCIRISTCIHSTAHILLFPTYPLSYCVLHLSGKSE